MDRYEKIIEKIWKIERNKLKNEIAQNGIPPWLEDKIKKIIKRTFLNTKYLETIKKYLKDGNEIILTFLMKDPKRQNIYENIFKYELSKEGFYVEKLKPSGSSAYYLINDEIVSNVKNKPKELKSLDFIIKYKNRKIYVVNKYTNESGGAQDNQYNDVIIQLKNLGPKTKDYVWFCLDGKYYSCSKIKSLKEINKDAVIIDIEGIIKKLNFL